MPISQNLYKTDKFLETHQLLKLIQEEKKSEYTQASRGTESNHKLPKRTPQTLKRKFQCKFSKLK